jgi:P4 family phage/plasmid primase-like protien
MTTKFNEQLDDLQRRGMINYDSDVDSDDEPTQQSKNKDMILELGKIVNIEYLDNYHDWFKIVSSLISADYLSEADEISKRSDRYHKKNNAKIYKSISSNAVSLGTFYFYCKISNEKKYKKIRAQYDTFANYDDINQSDLAKLYHSLNPCKYALSDSFWYEYNKNNILIQRSPVKTHPNSLLNDITDQLQNHFNKIRNQITPNNQDYATAMKSYKSIYKKLGSSSFIKGIIDYLKQLYYVEDLENILNRNQKLICFDNMLFDMSIKKFRPIKHDDYISITTGYKINLDRSEDHKETINKLLYSIFENDEVVKYYMSITALSLFTSDLQQLYIHTGSGGNGKGVLSTLLRSTLGNYFLTGENTFLTTNYKANAPNPTLFNAKDKRLLFVSEPDNGSDACFFNMDLIKTITGGDPVTTRTLFGTNITYIPMFSTNIQANNKPDLKKLDKGILRRLVIIPYKLNFVDNPKLANERQRDYTLPSKMSDPELINEFIHMLIDVAKDLIDTDYSKLPIPDAIKEETSDYIDNNNPIKDWLSINIEVTSNSKDRIKTTELLKLYNEDEATERSLNSKEFLKYMTFNGIESKKIRGFRYYVGVKEIEREREQITNQLDFFD